MAKASPPTDLNSFLCGIGHICLQWARLEHALLGIIAAADHLPLSKVYTRFGGLDIHKRFDMAIDLALEAKWPVRLTKRIANCKKALGKDGTRIAERRNLFVHGAQSDADEEGEVKLTIARWKGDKQTQVVSLIDAIALSNEIIILAQEAESIFDDYGVWKFGADRQKHRGHGIAQTKATTRLVRAHNIKRALKLLFANLKP